MKKIKKTFLAAAIISSCFSCSSLFAADLYQVYKQAVISDPIYNQALAQKMSDIEYIPMARAALLPQLGAEGSGTLNRREVSGFQNPPIAGTSVINSRGLGYNLTLSQSIIDFAAWGKLAGAELSVKAAIATYNASAQDLIQRTASAYFAVLQAQEQLRYSTANKQSIYQEYVRAQQTFQVGVSTITDVYNARAAYDASVAELVNSTNELSNKKEDLRSITGQDYSELNSLRANLPLVSPNPENIDQWVNTAVNHNWTLQASHYGRLASREKIKENFSGHLPTVALTGQYSNNDSNIFDAGKSRQIDTTGMITVKMPLFSGGYTTAATHQAKANYEVASNQEEETYRSVINGTRKAYLGIISGINKINADKEAVKSTASSLEGTQEGYKVGTRTMVDVLNAQSTLYKTETALSADRYSYVNSLIALKQAAGTLNENDIVAINQWLEGNHYTIQKDHSITSKKIASKLTEPTKYSKTTAIAEKTNIAPTQKTHLASTGTYKYYLQTGAFHNQYLATAMKKKIDGKLAVQTKDKIGSNNMMFHYVFVGPFDSFNEANQAKTKLASLGINKTFLTKDF